ncbi:MAG TPA: glycoside hydrolase family 3 C-terminal domain-containing protein [candidate division Zixibacteria bacterium]|nr:glycoside hydrolase family 3 C-terminal domain-containing protein [candidate division Zixibacteria bacterium]
MKVLKFILLSVLACISAPAAPEAQPYRDPSLPVDRRIDDLLSRMTPEEKFRQLFMLAENPGDSLERHAHGVFGFQIGGGEDAPVAVVANRIQRHFVERTRLGIPVILFAEALHGLVQKGATSFPQAIALAATFDTALMHDVAATIAEECRARGIRQVLSPVVNIASDARWGRVEETYGEDPFLVSAMGVAFVSEFERRGVITTPKHFIANVGDGGRDSYPVHMNERLLREIFLPPFAACIGRGGSRSIMAAYNSYDGSPCSASNWLNNHLLKEELAFPGFVISDAGGVGGANVLHFTAADYPEAGEHAINGGLDVIFQTSDNHAALFLPPFLDGRIRSDVIDRAVRRVLRVKFELGLFEDPYVDTADGGLRQRRETGRELARRAAREAIVLLKNDGNTLPLDSTPVRIAVIGPDAAEARLGGYSGPGNDPVSILEGIRARAGRAGAVTYARGCRRLDTAYVTVPSTVLSCVVRDSVRAGLLGAYYANAALTGAPSLVRVDPEIQFQWTLFSPEPGLLPYDCYSAQWTGTLTAPASGLFRIGLEGSDGYRLYLDDSLVLDRRRQVSSAARLAEFRFEQNRRYAIRLEFAEPAGNARLRLVWDVGVSTDGDSLPAEAVAAAAASDVALVVVGLEEGEFRDRVSLPLPGRQEELIRRVAATGTPVIVAIVGGSAVTMSRWIDSVAAVLEVWYPGEAGGDAVADVVFGDVNPGGRLPITFPLAEGQLPLVYNHKPTGRGDDYFDLSGRPLFPFGYGLSYTQFAYGDLRFDRGEIGIGDTGIVRFTVTNVGAREGDEVVQLYVRDLLASVARPVIELKGFRRVHLKPGQTAMVTMEIPPEALTTLDERLRPTIEPGDFRVMIGSSSTDIRLHGTLRVRP